MEIGAQTKEDCNKPKLRLISALGRLSPAQKQAWKRFWQKMIAEAQSEAKHG